LAEIQDLVFTLLTAAFSIAFFTFTHTSFHGSGDIAS
jgi:hypothetical protein